MPKTSPPMSVIQDQLGVGQGSRVQRRRPRSAVTSGRKLFVAGNPNSAWARRFFDITQGLVGDAGGRDRMSEAKFALCKRAAALQCELEQLEGRLSQGEEVDLDKFGRAASHLRRILETLGLERIPRDVSGVTLGELLRQDQRQQREASAVRSSDG
jgi:hypothetical protein